jgi:hypothetical protein
MIALTKIVDVGSEEEFKYSLKTVLSNGTTISFFEQGTQLL